ncbi:prolyl oligopeptidase family serine peptidase [Kordia antarctica]|nr:prolyl oligopeptidase family serine peptidase [Kordia antarctica]
MIKKLTYIFLTTLLIISCSEEVYRGESIKGVNAVDTYHGIELNDPYRNLENLKDSTVLNWMKQQNDYAENIVANISGRNRLIEIQKRIDENKGHSAKQIRIIPSGQYFYLKKFAEEDVFNVYYRDSLHGEEKMIFNVNVYLKKNSKENYVINYIKPNWSGTKIALSFSEKGNEISEIVVFDRETNTILPNVYPNSAPASLEGIHWLSDDSGFMCSYLPYTDPTDENFWLDTKTFLYKIGNDKGKDIFSKNNNPELAINIEDFPTVYNYSNDDAYLFGEISGDSDYQDMYYMHESEINAEKTKWNLLFTKDEKISRFMVVGKDIIYLTAKNASNFKICKTALENPNFESPEVIITEREDAVISNFQITKDGFFYVSVKNGIEAKLFHVKDTTTKEINLPSTAGSISIGSFGTNHADLRIYTSGWTNPLMIYEYDVNKNNFSQSNIINSIFPDGFKDFTAEEIEIPSHDGTMLPVSLIYKKGMKKNSKNPTLFYSYGSYGSSLSPFFSTNFLLWVKEGGIIVMPHVRGGGEKGDAWHKAGMKTTKPNSWKDFIAAVEYMIANKYTSPDKTVIWGTSAGGIVVGRAMTERPDLFKAVLGFAPAMNMVRSEIQPNGLNSIKEFGTVKDSTEFRALLEMDSYHNIKKGEKYPAVLILAGLKDGRVVAWDPAKFVAKLLDSSTSKSPILFLVDSDAGHGGINLTENKLHVNYANMFSFAFWQTGHPDYKLDEESK